jgi:hypothetical protein
MIKSLSLKNNFKKAIVLKMTAIPITQELIISVFFNSILSHSDSNPTYLEVIYNKTYN